MRAALPGLALLLVLPGVAAAGLPGPGAQAEDATVTASCLLDLNLVCTFDPPLLQVAPGTTVTWVVENACHTFTAGISAETELAEQLAFGVGNLNAFGSGQTCAGGSFSHTFANAGAYKYYCAVGFHRFLGMQGVVLVSDA
jgi:plastocyanin